MIPDPNLEAQVVKEIAYPLFSSRGWIKLYGWYSIISGVLLCLTIVGAIVGWLPIWMGVLLNRAASSVENAGMTGHKYSLLKSQASLKTFFTINGVLLLISLILTAIYICAIIFLLTSGTLAASDYF